MATKKTTPADAIISERAKIVFNAIVENDGEVYAMHNGEEVQLKTVAVADGKLVGIVSTTKGGVKTIDISGDEVIRIRTETILAELASDDGKDE